MFRNLVKTFVIVLSLLSVSCSLTSTRLHPTLEQELKLIDSVVVIPPRVAITLVTLTGEDERMTEKETTFSQEISTIAKKALQEKGYQVVDYDVAGQISSDEEFAYVIQQIQDGFDQAGKDLKLGLSLSETEAKTLKASVGESVNILAERSQADAILLTRFTGFDKSGGHVAKDIGISILVGVLTLGAVVPVSEISGATTQAALIDATTGEILWANSSAGVLSSKISNAVMSTIPDDIDDIAQQDE